MQIVIQMSILEVNYLLKSFDAKYLILNVLPLGPVMCVNRLPKKSITICVFE